MNMTFDIKRLGDFEPGEEEFYDYQDELLKLFADSPEGKARAEVDDGMAFWAKSVIDYGYNYVGVALHEMDANEMEELLTEVFPRKISLSAPDDADEGLPAMIAFWEYLKREYQLSNAENILRYLRAVKPADFKKWMNDSSRFGIAKSLFSMAQSEGFDLSNEEESNAFRALYNARLQASKFGGIPLSDGNELSLLSGGLPAFGDSGGKSKKERDKARHKRKIARASRKKNRNRK
jgi:hypothetical protein